MALITAFAMARMVLCDARLPTTYVSCFTMASSATHSPAAVQTLTASQATTVAVTVTNTGSLTWGANSAFRLAYHWYDGSGTTVVAWNGLRTYLPQTVGPSQSLALTASLQAPAAPGTYTLKWDMVQDGVTWFSSQGVATGNQTVTVQ